MFRLTLFYFLFFSLLSCQEKKTKISNITKGKDVIQSVIGQSFYRVEKLENNYVILEPCDAHIPKYVVYKDSIFHDWGQEHYSLNILSRKNTDTKIIFKTSYKYNGEKPDDPDSIIIFQSLDKEKKLWKINNEIFVNSRDINTISHKKQPCKECGNCKEEKAKEISVSSIFQRNIQWSNHCEKGVDKDNIMFYSEDEIAFNIGSINFICGAISKIINSQSIEIYLKQSGNDYAPNGEVYSNNNVPLGISFNDLSQTMPIAKVEILSTNELRFIWFGFYNNKTKKREYLKNPFTNKIEKSFVTLEKCPD